MFRGNREFCGVLQVSARLSVRHTVRWPLLVQSSFVDAWLMKVPVLVNCLGSMTKPITGALEGRKGLFKEGLCPLWWWRVMSIVMVAGSWVALHIACPARKQNKIRSSGFQFISLFCAGGIPANGMMPPMFRKGGLSSAKPFWKHRYTIAVSMVKTTFIGL